MQKPPVSQDDAINLTDHSENVSLHSSTTGISRFTNISQDEFHKLISLQVQEELRKYPSIFDDSESHENEKPKFFTKLKTKLRGLDYSNKLNQHFPFNYLVKFQDWYESLAKDYKFLRVLGSAGYFSILYPFIITGIVLGNVAKDQHIAIFVCNILAIIPLSVCISFLTETLAELTNPTVGGLLNITFGNAIELIFSVIALFKGQLDTVQGSMVGSWLATTQLILGCALFFASFNMKQLKFNALNCYFNVIFMIFSGCIFKLIYSLNYDSHYLSLFKNSTSLSPSSSMIKLSNGIAILHLILYIMYLIIPYQHRKALGLSAKNDEEKEIDNQTMHSIVRFSSQNRFENENELISSFSESNTVLGSTNVSKSIIIDANNINEEINDEPESIVSSHEDTEKKDKEKLSFWKRFEDVFIYSFFLLCITVIAAFNSDYLLDSLDGFSEQSHIPKPFITVILIPIFSNAAEHVTSIVVAYKGQLELALNVAVGSAIQINFMIVPFLILISNATKSRYTFLYENVYCESMFISALLASFSILNGKAYFATGSILLMNYVVCGVIIYFLN